MGSDVSASPNKGSAALSTAPFAEAAEAANICSETNVG
jgi:hypothetical protein